MHEKIREFILSNILTNKKVNIDDDTSLILSGLIDSFAILDIMQFVEETFNVIIPDEKVTRKDFDTINLINETIKKFQN